MAILMLWSTGAFQVSGDNVYIGYPRKTVEALDAQAGPVPGARIFVADLWAGGGFAEYLGKTNDQGKTKPAARPMGFLIGIAPDGRVATSTNGSFDRQTLRFGPAAAVVVQLVDGSGAPIRNRQVFLSRTLETSPLRQYGFLRPLPSFPSDLQARF